MWSQSRSNPDTPKVVVSTSLVCEAGQHTRCKISSCTCACHNPADPTIRPQRQADTY
jgi:hypothetical protein